MRFIAVVTVVVSGVLLAASPYGAHGADGSARVVSSSDSRITLEIDLTPTLTPSRFINGTEKLEIDGYGSLSLAGEPSIPARDYLIGLPPSGSVSVSYQVLESRSLGRHRLEPVPFPVIFRSEDGLLSSSAEYRIEADVYDARQAVIAVTAQPEGHLRHQRVLPVRVEPVAHDPATGETTVATRLRIDIAISGGDRGLAVSGIPVQEIDVWERIYARVLVNPDQARGWRRKPARRIDDARRAAGAAQLPADPLVKLAVGQSAIHRVTASDVIDKGFPSGTPTDRVQLFQRAYDRASMAATIVDIPIKLIEDSGGVSGVFDGDDVVVFYGQRLREDTLRHDSLEKFTSENIYWLGASQDPQTRMTEKSVAPGTVSADTATAIFPVALHVEEDLHFKEETPPTNNLTFEPMREFFYYNGGFEDTYSVPFSLGAVKPGTTFEIKILFLGNHTPVNERGVMVRLINGKGTTRLNDATVPRSRLASYTSGALSSDLLVEGLNTIRIDPIGHTMVEALIDWMSVEYQSPYRAKGDMLLFDTGSLTGTQTMTVTGLTRTDVLLFDISDPLVPEQCVVDSRHFTDVGGGEQALSFEIDVTTPRRFSLVPQEQAKDVDNIIEDMPSSLIGDPAENGVDILVVSHRDYLGEMQRWIDYRRAQGYRVLLADVDDVFDEFNGGVNNARAIRDFVRHFFDKGSASFLVLVGDASEDNKGVHIESPPNFVPTESFPEHVSSAVFNEDEVVTTDKWYGMLGGDVVYESGLPPAAYYPDVIVGRLPSGSVDELTMLLDKTLEFEKPRADDFWRRRILRVADDAWSGPGVGQSCLQPPEAGFEQAEERAATIAEASMPGGYDVVRFFLSNRIEHPPGGCISAFTLTQRTRSGATPVLMGEIAEGATIVSFQAHMNRFQICHERLFTSSPSLGTPDYLNLQNIGRPFIVFGMGCHLSDFAVHKELSRNFNNGPFGDSLVELMLHLVNKGAVNSYASTGFEYLRENVNYTELLNEVFYSDPPTGPTLPSNNVQARWIMGELMATAEIENLLKYPVGSGGGARGQVKRYHILGDPLLRIDGGPPRFDVTVDGNAFQSGDLLLPGAGGDSVRVRALIADEVAIEKLSLSIDNVDATDELVIKALVDTTLDAARQYEVTFDTKVLPKQYDIVLTASQASDTTGGYHIAAEFLFRIQIDVALSINQRPIVDGDVVPGVGDYLFELEGPVSIDAGSIGVRIDGNDVPSSDLDLSHPSPEDSTTWLVGFSASLSPGPHTVSLFVGSGEFPYNVSVGSQSGVRDLIAYPNPFQDETYFVYTNDVEISSGTIDVFTTSGKKVARIDIPVTARSVGQNAVRWDGTTWDGGQVANGVYLFVMSIDQRGQASKQRGKLVRVR